MVIGREYAWSPAECAYSLAIQPFNAVSLERIWLVGYIAKVHASEKAVTRKSFDLCVNGKVIGTATRETLPDFNNYERYYKSKIWTLSYEMPVQANDENGNPMTDENGNPVYKSETQPRYPPPFGPPGKEKKCM